jgi:hypothetical protein
MVLPVYGFQSVSPKNELYFELYFIVCWKKSFLIILSPFLPKIKNDRQTFGKNIKKRKYRLLPQIVDNPEFMSTPRAFCRRDLSRMQKRITQLNRSVFFIAGACSAPYCVNYKSKRCNSIQVLEQNHFNKQDWVYGRPAIVFAIKMLDYAANLRELSIPQQISGR